MPQDGIDALEVLRREVRGYLDGSKRAQADMFAGRGSNPIGEMQERILRGEVSMTMPDGETILQETLRKRVAA